MTIINKATGQMKIGCVTGAAFNVPGINII